MSIINVKNTSIPFMYPTSGYTWYDTRNLTSTVLTDKGVGGYNGTMSIAIPSVLGPYTGMRALAFPAGATISCPIGYTTNDFTISYWVYFIDKTQTGGTSTYQYITTGGRLTTQQYYNNTNIAYDAGGSVAFGQTGAVWTHLTYVYTTSGTTNITVYKNGSQVATANVAISAAATWQFGSATTTFQSYLSDMRIVPFKLTAAQALSLYQAYPSGDWSISPSMSPLTVKFNNTLPVPIRQSFLGTGAVQTFTVPAGVTAIRFFMWGAGGLGQNGGTITNLAGAGAYVDGNLITSPGTTYSIIVGRAGLTGLNNGGGTTGGTSAGGGGFSGIFSSTPAVNTVIAIAGGGGGSGFNGGGAGGGGGYPAGSAGSGTQSQGGGGTQTAGGSSGATAGSALAGGNGGGGDQGGGGGGGGWFGGGGGIIQGAGGGGSSTYTSIVISPVTLNGGNGSSSGTIPTPPGGNTSPYWVSPYGSAGQDGLVVIGYNSVAIPPSLRFTPYDPIIRTTSSFYSTGTVQTFTVPAGITSIRIFCWGAGGIGQNAFVNTNLAGSGAFTAASYGVTPGQLLYVVVGTVGVTGIANGGGSTGGTNAGGGGFSGIFTGISPTQNNVLLIAGGGGGSGFNGGGAGGAGGYPTGSAGSGSQSQGGGGTQTGGGSSSATPGSGLAGGNGGGGDQGGGGGGGGWFGGGGGIVQGAGGGGSSFAAPVVLKNIQFVNGINGGGVTTPTPAANESSPYWQTPYGRGGQNGLVVIGY